MAQDGVGALIVVAAYTPVGSIADRDLVLRVMATELRPQGISVSAAMICHPVCVMEYTVIEEARALRRGYHVRRLVVNKPKE